MIDEEENDLEAISQLMSMSSSFNFLKEEDEHYTLADAKFIYTS